MKLSVGIIRKISLQEMKSNIHTKYSNSSYLQILLSIQTKSMPGGTFRFSDFDDSDDERNSTYPNILYSNKYP